MNKASVGQINPATESGRRGEGIGVDKGLNSTVDWPVKPQTQQEFVGHVAIDKQQALVSADWQDVPYFDRVCGNAEFLADRRFGGRWPKRPVGTDDRYNINDGWLNSIRLTDKDAAIARGTKKCSRVGLQGQ